jgi:hypothetical protein
MTPMTASDIDDRTQGALLTEQPPRSPSWLGAVRRRLMELAAHEGGERHLWQVMGDGLSVLVSVAEAVPNLQQPALDIADGSLVISWIGGGESRALCVAAGPRVFLTVDGVRQRNAPTDLTGLVRALQSSATGRGESDSDSEPELHRRLSTFVRTLQTPSRPHASENLRALARRAIAARNAEPTMTNEEWAAGFANLVIDGFDE